MKDFPELPTEKIKCHAEKCPVCNGHGSVNYGKLICRACNGKCFIIIPNDIEDAEGAPE